MTKRRWCPCIAKPAEFLRKWQPTLLAAPGFLDNWMGEGAHLWHPLSFVTCWGIALLEYFLQVPATRIGHTQLTLGQLKVLQEVITLTVFVPFAWLYMREPLRWNYLWAGLCLCGAVFFMFRK